MWDNGEKAPRENWTHHELMTPNLRCTSLFLPSWPPLPFLFSHCSLTFPVTTTHLSSPLGTLLSSCLHRPFLLARAAPPQGQGPCLPRTMCQDHLLPQWSFSPSEALLLPHSHAYPLFQLLLLCKLGLPKIQLHHLSIFPLPPFIPCSIHSSMDSPAINLKSCSQ